MVARSAARLVAAVCAALPERFLAMRAYTDQQHQHTAEDIAHVVDFLATALYVGDVELFTGFLTWTADILTARAVPLHSLIVGLDLLSAELRDFPRASRFLAEGTTHLERIDA